MSGIFISNNWSKISEKIRCKKQNYLSFAVKFVQICSIWEEIFDRKNPLIPLKGTQQGNPLWGFYKMCVAESTGNYELISKPKNFKKKFRFLTCPRPNYWFYLGHRRNGKKRPNAVIKELWNHHIRNLREKWAEKFFLSTFLPNPKVILKSKRFSCIASSEFWLLNWDSRPS